MKMHDRQAAVRRILTYLHFIRDRGFPELPPLTPDGIYGEETRAAVIAFQVIMGLEGSGIVDIETNDAIYSVYESQADVEIISEFDVGDFPVAQGSGGAQVGAVNRILNSLRDVYADMPRADRGDRFGQETKRAVKYIETVFGRAPSGVVDAELYSRIVRESRNARLLSEIYI